MVHTTRTHAAADGGAVTFPSLQGFADAQGTGVEVEYMSERSVDQDPGSNGWATHAITPRQLSQTIVASTQGFLPLYEGEMSSDLTKGIFSAWSPLTNASAVSDFVNIYVRPDLRSPGPGTYRLVTDSALPLPALLFAFQSPLTAGVSEDFRHVIFESRMAYLPGATFGVPNLYEWADGTLRLAGILPDSACGTPPCVAPSSFAGQGALDALYTRRTISEDGSRIIFTWRDPSIGSPARQGRLYVRSNGATTVEVSASEKTVPDAPQPARFSTASADGKKVLFTTSEQLIDSDTDSAQDIYMYDEDAPPGGHLTRLSTDGNSDDPPNSMDGVIGASDDARYVYFIGAGQIVPRAPLFTTRGLYVWHDGNVRFIGELRGADDFVSNISAVWNLTPRHSRVTPDGKTLAFISRDGSSLTGYDHGSSCPLTLLNFDIGTNPCVQLYVYRADTGVLSCASCMPNGGPANSSALPYAQVGTGGSLRTSHVSHALSDDGKRLFFNTRDPLVAGDTNGKVDAYEYDIPTRTAHLISSGKSTSDSYFMDASANGDDVFFTTREQLVGWDTDFNTDLYDARVGGGFPEPAPAPVPCAGSACQGQAQTPPTLANPSSSALRGKGDAEQQFRRRRKACRAGKVRKKVHGRVRCVKRAHRAKRRTARKGGSR